MTTTVPTPTTFDALTRLPDDAIDVALGAALIAKDVYAELDIQALLDETRALAGPIGGGALAGLSLEKQAAEVSARFRELGFHGNVEDYYDAKNSLLPDVLERKTGIPITLSLVWCEIAKPAGVLARGVGFPGHFLVRLDEITALSGRVPSEPVIVDPFNSGRIIDHASAKALLRRTLGDGAEIHPASHFAPIGARATLVRMLTNLKAIYANHGDHTRAFVAIDRIVTLTPDSPRVLRERAGVALRLGLAELARSDLAKVLSLEPQAPDAPMIEQRIKELRTNVRSAPN